MQYRLGWPDDAAYAVASPYQREETVRTSLEPIGSRTILDLASVSVADQCSAGRTTRLNRPSTLDRAVDHFREGG